MTEEQLKEIEDRAKAISYIPTYAYELEGVLLSRIYEAQQHGWETPSFSGYTRPLSVFYTEAKHDIPRLIAEVRYLKKALEAHYPAGFGEDLLD